MNTVVSFLTAAVPNHHTSVAGNNTNMLSYSSRGQEFEMGLTWIKSRFSARLGSFRRR